MSPIAVRAACDIPTGFNSVYQISTSQTIMNIGWNYPQDDGGCVIQYYSVQIDDGAGGPFTTLQAALSSSQFKYTITSTFTLGATYRVQIDATNNVGTMIGNVVSIIASNVPATPTLGPYRDTSKTSEATSINLLYDYPISNGGSNIISYQL